MEDDIQGTFIFFSLFSMPIYFFPKAIFYSDGRISFVYRDLPPSLASVPGDERIVLSDSVEDGGSAGLSDVPGAIPELLLLLPAPARRQSHVINLDWAADGLWDMTAVVFQPTDDPCEKLDCGQW